MKMCDILIFYSCTGVIKMVIEWGMEITKFYLVEQFKLKQDRNHIFLLNK